MSASSSCGLILVIEDDVDTRAAMVALLESAGFEAEGVGGAEAALGRLRGDGMRPAAILLDLMMPGMSSWQFRDEQLRDPGIAAIPVVIVSAYPSTLRTMSHGPNPPAGAMLKPINPAELLDLVRRLSAARPPAASDRV
jgi:CheY-like chemotaxis protein